MRARQRHLNARHAGAMFVLDARFINQADNTAVSTWADRSGNGYDVSQATGTNQPTLQTGEVGGSSIVRFDGSNDTLGRSDTGFPTGDITFISVSKQNNSLPNLTYAGVMMYGQSALTKGVLVLYATDTNYGTNGFGPSQYGDGVAVSNSTGVYNVSSWYRSSTNYSVHINGGTASTKSMTTATALQGTNGLHIGSSTFSQTTPANFLNGDIGNVILFASSLADSLRRRLERGCGLTWKIACS